MGQQHRRVQRGSIMVAQGGGAGYSPMVDPGGRGPHCRPPTSRRPLTFVKSDGPDSYPEVEEGGRVITLPTTFSTKATQFFMVNFQKLSL
jgi:hypothetical protein